MKKLFLNRRQHFSSLSDEQLADLYRTNNDPHVFEILFERYIHLIFAIAVKYLKDEDLARDAAMQIADKLTREIPKHEIKVFKNWVHTVAKNHCLMQLRKNKLSVVSLDEIKEKNLGNSMEFVDDWHPINGDKNENKIKKLHGALTKIKKEQAECIRLFYLEKRTYHEIEEITGFTNMQVKSYIQNGKRKLKMILTEDEDFR